MKLLKFVLGAACGAAAGFAAGILLAPRTGAESRAMASDAVNDAWDSAVDTYERGQQAVANKFEGLRPDVDATTDELRAKVDLARERMDQLRDSLNGAEAASAEPTADDDEAEQAAPEIEIVETAADDSAASDEESAE